MSTEWFVKFARYLRNCPPDMTAEQFAARIQEALKIAEAEKYATPKTCFEFTVVGATEYDLEAVRELLTPFENSIVKLVRGKHAA